MTKYNVDLQPVWSEKEIEREAVKSDKWAALSAEKKRSILLEVAAIAVRLKTPTALAKSIITKQLYHLIDEETIGEKLKGIFFGEDEETKKAADALRGKSTPKPASSSTTDFITKAEKAVGKAIKELSSLNTLNTGDAVKQAEVALRGTTSTKSKKTKY